MTREEKVKVITEQVMNMYDNNVLNGNGSEGFMGWLEDGEVFANMGCYSAIEVKELTDFARGIAPLVDELTYKGLHLEEF